METTVLNSVTLFSDICGFLYTVEKEDDCETRAQNRS